MIGWVALKRADWFWRARASGLDTLPAGVESGMGSVTNDSYFWPWHPVVVKAVTEVRPLDRASVVFWVFTSCSNKVEKVLVDRVRKIKKTLNGR